jgi:hypothetical protein
VSDGEKPEDLASLHRRFDELEHVVAQRVAETCAAVLRTPERTAGAVKPAWRRRTRGERRWQVAASTAVAIGLQVAVPGRLAVLRPVWILPALQGILLLTLLVANPHRIDRESRVLRILGLTLAALISFASAWSLVSLAAGLVRGTEGENAGPLLVTGGAIWLTNVIVFGLWYWEFDRGGPSRARPRDPPVPGLPVRADDQPGAGAARLGTRLRRLPLPGLHQRVSVQPGRCDAAVPLGEARHGPAVGHFHHHGGTDRGACRQHLEVARRRSACRQVRSPAGRLTRSRPRGAVTAAVMADGKDPPA